MSPRYPGCWTTPPKLVRPAGALACATAQRDRGNQASRPRAGQPRLFAAPAACKFGPRMDVRCTQQSRSPISRLPARSASLQWARTRRLREQQLLSSSGLMDTRPGLAPGKSGFADRRLVYCGMRVVMKWRGVPVMLRPRECHRLECCCYTIAPLGKKSARGELHSQGSPLLRRCGLLFPLNHGPNEKLIPRPELHRLGPLYERGA